MQSASSVAHGSSSFASVAQSVKQASGTIELSLDAVELGAVVVAVAEALVDELPPHAVIAVPSESVNDLVEFSATRQA